jgi:hypothetical protein
MYQPSHHDFLMLARFVSEPAEEEDEVVDDTVCEDFVPPVYSAEFLAGLKVYRTASTHYPVLSAMLRSMSQMRVGPAVEYHRGWNLDNPDVTPHTVISATVRAMEEAQGREQETNDRIQRQLAPKKLQRMYEHKEYSATALDSLLDSFTSMLFDQNDPKTTELGEHINPESDMFKACHGKDASRINQVQALSNLLDKETFLHDLDLDSKFFGPAYDSFINLLEQNRWLSAVGVLVEALWQFEFNKVAEGEDVNRQLLRRELVSLQMQLLHILVATLGKSVDVHMAIVLDDPEAWEGLELNKLLGAKKRATQYTAWLILHTGPSSHDFRFEATKPTGEDSEEEAENGAAQQEEDGNEEEDKDAQQDENEEEEGGGADAAEEEEDAEEETPDASEKATPKKKPPASKKKSPAKKRARSSSSAAAASDAEEEEKSAAGSGTVSLLAAWLDTRDGFLLLLLARLTSGSMIVVVLCCFSLSLCADPPERSQE